MKTITIYETESYGGSDGREVIVRRFETEEQARENAMNDKWNTGFTMSKVTITFDGMITETSEYIGRIADGSIAIKIEQAEHLIETMKKHIEEEKNNKRIKETTREKRIADYTRIIEEEERNIEEMKKIK